MNNYVKSNSQNGKNKKKKFKFNFIDFLIVLLVLMIIFAAVYVFAPFSWIEKRNGTTELQYTIEFQAVDEAFIENIKENDLILVLRINAGNAIARSLRFFRNDRHLFAENRI